MGGAAAPIQSAVIADLSVRDKRTFYFSTFSFLSGAFGALGALGSRLFTVHMAFLAATLISAVGVPLVLWLSVEDSGGKLKRLRSRVVIGKFSLTGLLSGLSSGLIVPFLIPFFVLVYSLPKSTMAVYGFISGGLASVALLAAPALERKLGFLNSILLTRGLGLALFVIFPIIRFLPAAVAIYILAPSLRVAALPIQQSELTKRVYGDEMGRALGINQVARLAASSAGSGISGHLLENSMFELPFFLYGLIMAGNLLLYVRFFGMKSKQEADQKPVSVDK